MAEHAEGAAEPAGDPELAPIPATEPNATAVSMALGKASRDKTFTAEAAAFLRDQRRMLALQMEHLHEQRSLQVEHLKHQEKHLRLRYFGDRLRIGLQLLGILGGLAVAAFLGAMAWNAHEDHGVAIEAFSVPPDLAQRGVTGQVIASQILDRLASLQAKTVTARPASTYANDWGGDIKVEIPETGVSIGELNRYLRQWLGSETRITGEVFRTRSGLAVTARAGAHAGQTYAGPDADLDQLVQKAAEAVYAQTQPYRWSVYLASNGRQDEALRNYAWLAVHGSPEDRAWANAAWGTLVFLRGDLRGALQKTSRAIEIDPRVEPAYPINNNALAALGRREGMLAGYRTQLRMLESRRAEGASPEAIPLLIAMLKGSLIPSQLGDFAGAAQTDRSMPSAVDVEGAGGALSWRGELAADLAQLHDIAAALDVEKGSPPDIALDARVAITRALEDWPAHLRALDRRTGVRTTAPDFAADRVDTLVHMGRLAEARAAIAATPMDCDLCVAVRGETAAAGGDRREADRWFAEAAARSPSIPFIHRLWGEALLRLGDADAAIDKARTAHQRGPRWADPLELWGEALLRKGAFADAAPKFAEADERAPRWGKNHLMWGQALMLAGRYAEARRQYAVANDLYLSKPDRAALNVLLERTARGPLHG